MTQGLENALYRMINSTDDNKSMIYNKENESIYTNFLTIDVSNQSDILCPLYCLKHVCKVLTHSNNEETSVDEVIIPLDIAEFYDGGFKTIDSALKYVFSRTIDPMRLFKSVIKEEIFYGSRNLLLDDSFNILFMPCVKMDFIEQKFKDFIIVVDYNLLSSSTTVVSKAVMKKLIPFYISWIIDYSANDMNIKKTPSVFFTNTRGINSISSTTLAEVYPYDILNAELYNLVNSIDYVS